MPFRGVRYSAKRKEKDRAYCLTNTVSWGFQSLLASESNELRRVIKRGRVIIEWEHIHMLLK